MIYSTYESSGLILSLLVDKLPEDLGVGIDLIMFTNETVSALTKASDLVQPTGGGYAPKIIADNSWVSGADDRAHAQIIWTATSDYNEVVYGHAFLSRGTAPRIILMDHVGATTILDTDTYAVNPLIGVR